MVNLIQIGLVVAGRGALTIGNHIIIKLWSSTQKNITLSSAEAELVASVKVYGECIGLVQLTADWGLACGRGDGKLRIVDSGVG